MFRRAQYKIPSLLLHNDTLFHVANHYIATVARYGKRKLLRLYVWNE